MKNIKYKIVKATKSDEIEKQIGELLNNGWQGVGPLIVIPPIGACTSYHFYHEMIYVAAEPPAKQQAPDAIFFRRLAHMDPAVRELLDINNIQLDCQQGVLLMTVGEKTVPEITPNGVLMALKNSKHCPMDLDENKILTAIQELICES